MIKCADFTGEFEAICEPWDRLWWNRIHGISVIWDNYFNWKYFCHFLSAHSY